jgi:hypothetical protein
LFSAGIYNIFVSKKEKESVREKKVLAPQNNIIEETENTSATGNVAEKPQEPHFDVFISYSKHDKNVADALCATLESRKIRCWIAPRDVRAGMDWPSAIIQALNSSRIFVLVFSSSSNKSHQTTREIERAVSKGMPSIPLRIEKYRTD